MPKKKEKKDKSWKEKLRKRQIRHQRALEAYRIQKEREAERKPRKWPKGKILMAICLLLLIFGSYAAWQYMNPPPSSEGTPPPSQQTPPQTSPTTETIYILANGTVYPSTAPILNVRNAYYTFKEDINTSIVVERDNIVIDGAGYVLQGGGVYGSKGIDLTGRSNVTIKNVEVKGFDYGIYLNSGSNNLLYKNVLTSNYCGIWLAYSSANNITSNAIINNEGYAIWLKNSSANNISGNKITLHGNYTIYLRFSNGNHIYANNIANNTLCIFIYSSSNNTISRNIITNSHQGIHLSDSVQNLIILNNITRNDIGISLSTSSDNMIYHNNFSNNTKHADTQNSVNIWDNGYPYGGNYWSDYKVTYPDAERLNGSGIWNTPYVIDENNQDRYPKIEPIF